MNEFIHIGIHNGLMSWNIEKLHLHKHWEIVYYTEGTGILTVGKNKWQFHPEMIVILPPYIEHDEITDGNFGNIYLIVDDIAGFSEEPVFFNDNPLGYFREIMMQIYGCYHESSQNMKELANSLTSVLIAYAHIWAFNKHSRYVDYCISAIRNGYYDSNFSLDSVYQKIPMSKIYFISLFKKEMSVTPHEYMTSCRIEFAKKLLIHDHMSPMLINRISQMSGFKDPYYFSRIFKKYIGISPEKWVCNTGDLRT